MSKLCGYIHSVLLGGLLSAIAGTALAQDGDSARGEKVFKKCASCHMVGPEARKRTGPVLNDIIGASAGAVPEFKYSKAMVQAGAEGLTWTRESLDAFLADPKSVVPKNRMSFRGLTKPEDRADVIAYLQEFSGGNMGANAGDDFAVSPEVLAIVGDAEYGEYLSSECTTCHRADGENDGIPGIVGWEAEMFVTAMHAYREQHREHPVMQMVAGRLADDEIAALAAYFEGLEN